MLSFYMKERKLFPTAYKLRVSDEEAIKIAKKLKRHFKIPGFSITFYNSHKNTDRGKCLNPWLIRLAHSPSVGTICHELAHLYNRQHYGNWNHNNRLLRTLRMLIGYCERKNYWNSDILLEEE